MPEFLNTCGKTQKKPAVNLGVRLEKTFVKQEAVILSTVMEHYKRVPVLIITRSEQELDRIYTMLVDSATKEKLLSRVVGLTRPEDLQIQRLQEHDPSERDHLPADKADKKEKWIELRVRAIDNAMKMHSIKGSSKDDVPKSSRGGPNHPANSTSSSGGEDTYFQITVTDKWGGRGHDFESKHAKAEENGGPLVIATSIPDTREWTQWKGRTARQDKKGQYLVVLSEQSERDIAQQSASETSQEVEKRLNTVKSDILAGKFDSAIEVLTDAIDSSVDGRLKDFRAKQVRGVWLSQLCGLYYETHARDIQELWPFQKFLKEDQLFSKLLVDMNYYQSGEKIREAVKVEFPKFDLKGPPVHWDQFPQGFGIPGNSCVQLRPQPNTLMFVIDESFSMDSREDMDHIQVIGTAGLAAAKEANATIEKRLRHEGGELGALTISLIWNNFQDLDLYVVTPGNKTICYSAKFDSESNGVQDIDYNYNGKMSDTPIENIYWSGIPPNGRYKVKVLNWHQKEVECWVRVKARDVITMYDLKTVSTGGSWATQEITFDYHEETILREQRDAPTRLSIARKCIHQIIEDLSYNDKVGLVTFASDVKRRLDPTALDSDTNSRKIADAMDVMKTRGKTHFYEAIQTACQTLILPPSHIRTSADEGAKWVIALTDGADTMRAEEQTKAVEMAAKTLTDRHANLNLGIITLGPVTGDDERKISQLKDAAERGGGKAIRKAATDVAGVRTAFEEIASAAAPIVEGA